MPIQSISKFDAATRLLQAAIQLYFQDADILAVHTVAGASHGVLRDLLQRKGAASSRTGSRAGQPRHVALVTKMVHNAKNFLKHADRDPSNVLKFNTDSTEYLIYDAIVMHIELARNLTRENIFFLLWVAAKYPKLLLFDNLVVSGNLSGNDMDELRRVFPTLGVAQKRTFLRALQAPLGRG